MYDHMPYDIVLSNKNSGKEGGRGDDYCYNRKKMKLRSELDSQ